MTISRRTVLKSGVLAGFAALAAERPAFAQAAGRKVRFATEGGFPPFNQTSPNGSIVGFEPEMVKVLSERGGFTYEIVAQAWDGMIQGLIDGKYDAIIDAVSITPKRLEVVNFSLPYTSGGSSFVTLNASKLTLPGDGKTVNLSDVAATEKAVAEVAEALKGKTVAVQVSTIQADFLTKYLGEKGVTIRTYQAGADTYQDLKNGRADAVMASITNLSAFLQKNAGTASISGPRFIGGIMGLGAGIVVRKTDDALRETFDKALRSAAADGTLQGLSNKWFGLDLIPTY